MTTPKTINYVILLIKKKNKTPISWFHYWMNTKLEKKLDILFDLKLELGSLVVYMYKSYN